MMDVSNSVLTDSSKSTNSAKQNHVIVGDKFGAQESVENNYECGGGNKGSAENKVKDKFKEDDKNNLRKGATLGGDFTDVDKSFANFVDEEHERERLAKISRKTPEKIQDVERQGHKSSDEASSGNEESFPRESSSDSTDCIDLEQSAKLEYPDAQNPPYLSINDIQDFIDSRVAEARLEVVENKIDRVLLKIDDIKDEHQRNLFQVLLARIKELEDKLDKKSVVPKKGSNRSGGLPVEQFSSYVVEKATQTPSEEHDCEGVYVLVSKKNKQQVRQVHRQVAYVLSGGNTEGSKSEEPQSKHPQPKGTKKVIKRVGYPEYLYEESLQGRKGCHNWNKYERKTVTFLPPIPDPYSRRRPRNTASQQNTECTCSKHHH